MTEILDYYLCYKEAFLLGVSFGILVSYTFAEKALQNHR
jgi:hypothetical protein